MVGTLAMHVFTFELKLCHCPMKRDIFIDPLYIFTPNILLRLQI